MIYGDNITKMVKTQIGSLLVGLLRDIHDAWLPVIVVGGFYLLGLGAQKKGMI